jgi:hypothetical protein
MTGRDLEHGVKIIPLPTPQIDVSCHYSAKNYMFLQKHLNTTLV